MKARKRKRSPRKQKRSPGRSCCDAPYLQWEAQQAELTGEVAKLAAALTEARQRNGLLERRVRDQEAVVREINVLADVLARFARKLAES